MFNKKEMKLITDYRKVQELLMNGTQVFMVQLDGSLVEITADTNWKTLFFHNMKQGSYAIYRRRFNGISEFSKTVRVGKRAFTVEHSKEGGGASWKFASCRDSQ